MLLEIAVFSIESALAAVAAGADRLELCENPFDGGTTPSYGTLKNCREQIKIPIFPIIRPRGGDFLYTDIEFEVMCADVQLCKQLGFEGVVLGILQADGSIDQQKTLELVALAYPMEVTFHRAFDRCKNPLLALEQIIDCGCQRILTSGQVPQAIDGIPLLKKLVAAAANRITVLPGSGVRSNSIEELLRETGVIEMHSSARIQQASTMQYTQTGMKESLLLTSVDVAEIKAMKKIMQTWQHNHRQDN